MRSIVATLSLVAAAMLGPSQVSSAEAATTYRILITGDSITQGSSGDYTWRYRLWNKLKATETDSVSFVGTRTDLYDNVNDTFGSYHYAADFGGKAHSARWGTSFQLQLSGIQDQVSSTNANVLVVMLGSNDLAYATSPAQTITNLKTYMGLLHRQVTSDLWCREVPLEGCAPCPSPIPESSVRTSCGLLGAVSPATC